MTHIITHSGIKFNVLTINPDHIIIEDICKALSRLCRWTGHTSQFYSVAQHSVHVENRVEHKHGLAALLHDASEAYLGDVSRPIKSMLTGYGPMEWQLQRAIYRKFCGVDNCDMSVKIADDAMLAIEQRQLMQGPEDMLPPLHEDHPVFVIPFWDYNVAYERFMTAFRRLS